MLRIAENATIDPVRDAAARTGQSRFVIARHASGSWFVSDRFGQVGGIFVSETAARHFAFEESFGHPEDIEVVREPLPHPLIDTGRAA